MADNGYRRTRSIPITGGRRGARRAAPHKQNRIRLWAVVLWLMVWELASLYIGQEILLVSPVSVLRRLCGLALLLSLIHISEPTRH